MTQSAVTLSTASHALPAIFFAGLACGVMDITAAFIVYGNMFHVGPVRILHNVASGLLGPRSYTGGLTTAAIGLLCHFVIAFGAAAVYYGLTRFLPILNQNPALFGPLYGIAVYFFMNRIVVPLSNVAKTPFSVKMMLIGVAIHIVCVGLPIALFTRHFSAQSH
jgi:hypothetical protein